MIEKNSFPNCIRLFSSFLSALTILAISNLTSAGISTDGTMGPATTLSPGGTSGKDYTIPQSLGQQKGANLFHSFRDFNVDTGYNATFTGSAGTANVIGRVTGGSASWIDGKLGCDIAGADLWLLNPFGILFGSKASLDVKGSFHASTADYLQLSDGGVFYSDSSKTSKLTVAAPSAFGFLSSQPQGISISGSNLSVETGKTLSLIGGDILIDNGQLVARSGNINLVSLASPRLVTLKDTNLTIEDNSELGNIQISSTSKIDVSGLKEYLKPNGTIEIRSKYFSLDDSAIYAYSYGDKDNAGDIRILSDSSIRITGNSNIRSQSNAAGKGGNLFFETELFSLLDGSSISAISMMSGNSGNIVIGATNVEIDGANSFVSTKVNYGATGNGGDIEIHTDTLKVNGCLIRTITLGKGSGGNISIQANNSLSLTNGGEISAFTRDEGDSGDISIRASKVICDGALSEYSYKSVILCEVAPEATGNGGTIDIEADSIKLTNGGEIGNDTYGAGNAGQIYIQATDILIDGAFSKGNGYDNSCILTQVTGGYGATGNGGTITIQTNSLKLTHGGKIVARTYDEGNGGEIYIVASEVLIDGIFGDNGIPSGLSGQAGMGYTGNAGNINLETDTLKLTNGGTIAADTYGQGNGGDINIRAKNIVIDGGYQKEDDYVESGIFSQTASETTGNAGSINIETESLELTHGAEISAQTVGSGNGGNINIRASNLFVGHGYNSEDYFINSNITSQAMEGATGNAGTILIDADSVKLSDGGQLTTSNFGTGNGGSIVIHASDMNADGAFSNQKDFFSSGIYCYSHSSGKEGTIILETETLNLTQGAQINATTFKEGDGGNITIRAADAIIDGMFDHESGSSHSGIYSNANVGSTGDAGSITLEIDTLKLTNGGSISASTNGTGNGGNIDIHATDVRIDGMFDKEASSPISGIYCQASPDSTGNAGSVGIETKSLKIANGGRIDSRTGGMGDGGNITISASSLEMNGAFNEEHASSITCEADEGASGNGGSIDIGASKLTMTSGAVISAASQGTGDAGSINLKIADRLESRNSTISTESMQADGGDITIRNTGFIVWLIDSAVTATVGGGPQTTGGNIRIDSPYVVLKDSQVIANAYEGKGGSIHIDADTYLADWTSTVSASSTKGINGQVDINSPLVDLSGLLSPLPTAFVDVTELLVNDCETRYKHGKTSSLVVRGRKALPAQPGDLWPSSVLMQ